MDIVVLGAWQVVDPMLRTLETFPLEVPEDTDDDVKIKPQLEHCESSYNTIWLGKSITISPLTIFAYCEILKYIIHLIQLLQDDIFSSGVLYSLKGLLLVFGLFLAYETRSVKLDKINDSRLVRLISFQG